MYRILNKVVFLCLSVWSFNSLAQLPSPLLFQPTYVPSIDFAQYALHQGNARSANLIEGLFPLYQHAFKTLSFVDLRFYNPNGTPIEGNIDLGFRRLFHQNKRLFGLYAGYDRYRSATRRYYSQVNAGFEFWFNKIFLGANAYVPFGTKIYDNDTLNLAYLVSTDIALYRYNIYYEQGKERVLPGGDAEIGYDITPNLTVYGGGYYFDHSSVKSIAGPKLRATYTFYRPTTHRLLKLFDRIRLEGLISHDSLRGTSWMAGLRFSFGLSKYATNPTLGIARHMVDPIRRDLNVIASPFRTPPQPDTLNGNLVQVDVVDGMNRTLANAISGVGSPADVLILRGTQTINSSGLVLGDRDLTITGGQFDFSVNGVPFSVPGGNDQAKVITTDNSFGNIFDVNDAMGDHHMTLENLTLDSTTNNAGFALNATGGGFGQITINNVTSSLPFNFSLEGTASTQGKVTFTNNQINLTDQELSPSISDFSAVRFVTDASSQELQVNDFSKNEINITDRSVAGNASAVYAAGDSSEPIDFTNGILNNAINLLDNTGIALTYGILQTNAVLSNSFHGNTIEMKGNENITFMVGWRANDSDLIVRTGDISDNKFIIDNNTAVPVGASYNGIYPSDNLILEGSLRNNTFALSNNDSNSAHYGIQIGDGSSRIEGSITGNKFQAKESSTGNSGGLFVNYDLTVWGDISDNTFTIDHDDDGYGIEVDTYTLQVNGSIKNNTFIAKHNAVGVGIHTIDGLIKVTKDIENNHFTAEENTQGYGIYLEYGSLDIGGNIAHNTFKTNHNTQRGYGIYGEEAASSHDFDIGGNIQYNSFTADHNGEASGIFLEELYYLNMQGSITQNEFSFKNNTDVYGLHVNCGYTIEASINNNTFNLSDNTDSSIAIQLVPFDNPLVFDGGLQYNNITIVGDAGSDKAGFDIGNGETGTITFNQIFTGNKVNINGSDLGANGFNLNIDGDIYFNANTAANLRSLNHNASVNTVMGTIHYVT